MTKEQQKELEGKAAVDFAATLKKVRTDADTWEIEYEDNDGGKWLMYYPNSHEQGGGSPHLRKL